MGIQWLEITATINMMKSIFLVAALVAAALAEPEADADAYYNTLGYTGLGYSNYGFNGFRSYAAPAYGYRSYGHGYASPYNYGAYHHFGKRSAEAEPEADAYYTLGYHGLGYSNYGFNGYRSYAAAPAYSYGVRSYGYASPYAYGRYHY